MTDNQCLYFGSLLWLNIAASSSSSLFSWVALMVAGIHFVFMFVPDKGFYDWVIDQRKNVIDD